jgi:hypothetical protein
MHRPPIETTEDTTGLADDQEVVIRRVCNVCRRSITKLASAIAWSKAHIPLGQFMARQARAEMERAGCTHADWPPGTSVVIIDREDEAARVWWTTQLRAQVYLRPPLRFLEMPGGPPEATLSMSQFDRREVESAPGHRTEVYVEQGADEEDWVQIAVAALPMEAILDKEWTRLQAEKTPPVDVPSHLTRVRQVDR